MIQCSNPCTSKRFFSLPQCLRPPSSTEVKNPCSHTSTPLHGLMECIWANFPFKKVHCGMSHAGLEEEKHSSILSLTSALDVGGWLTPRPGCFTPREKRHGTHWAGHWMGFRVRKIAPAPGFDPRTVQAVPSPYTDWATPFNQVFLLPFTVCLNEFWQNIVLRFSHLSMINKRESAI